MNRKAFSLIQHKLIPTALIAGNIALVHLIYLLAEGDSGYFLTAIAICIIVMATGILRPNKYVLLAGLVAYVLVFTFSCMA